MELTIEQALQKAVEAHKVGKLQDAEALYRAILQTQPKHPDANHNLGVMAVSLNKTAAAIPHFKIALEANPNQGQYWLSYVDALIKEIKFEDAKNLLEEGKKRGLAGEKVEAIEAKLMAIILAQDSESSRSPPETELNSLLEYYQKGQHDLALNLATSLTQQYPNHPFGFKVLGALFQQKGKLQDSVIANQKVLEISPNDPEAHNNLGITLQELGRLEDAEKSYNKAIAIKPDYPEAHSNLGNTLQELGRLVQAETSYKKAIVVKPDYAEAHSNLGNALQELGRLEDAETSYNKAIAIKPDYAEAHSNLGNTLKQLGRLGEAETSYKKAIAIKPDYAEAHSNLGNTLQELGRLEDAFNAVIKSIKIKPTTLAKILFVAISKKLNIQTWDHAISQLVVSALLEPWGRPSELIPFAIRLLKTEKEFSKLLKQSNKEIVGSQLEEILLSPVLDKDFDASKLLQAMLISTPIPDRQLETLFTALRSHLLKFASSLNLKEDQSDDVASLFCAIAQQCFINEYIYYQTIDEIDSSHTLRDLLSKALEGDQKIPSTWVIAVACYFPLYSIAGAEKLLQKKYSNDIYSVLVQQIQEPLVELTLRKDILNLTSIENKVSLKVQSQYEENPYPRWTRLPKDSNKKYFNAHIHSKFPQAGFQRLGEDRNLKILIAGCGTGQHSIGTSHIIRDVKILAVDLSMASLSYAKRKTEELGIESIEYAQADLLKLNLLGRTFDVIESSGVLHHLEKPFDGWEVLLSLLRPNGVMRLGFYSELARRDIVKVRNLISAAGIGSSSQDIRSYRKELLGFENSENYGFATSSIDFFSTSACRDHLFHVQEHRMNLRTLDKFCKDHDLNFLGFDIDSSITLAYKKRFLNDISGTNLEQWHIYEEENPDTFIGMYQFWIQKH